MEYLENLLVVVVSGDSLTPLLVFKFSSPAYKSVFVSCSSSLALLITRYHLSTYIELAPVTSVTSEVDETPAPALLEGPVLSPSGEPASADIEQAYSPGGTTEEALPEVDTNAAKTGTESEIVTEMTSPGGRASRLVKTPSGAEIKIGLEDESGEQKPVEIDMPDPAAEPDESPAPEAKRRVSISERVLKMKNSEEQLQCLAEDAEIRKKELASLLDEHAHLVEQVSTMEVHRVDPASPGSNKENKTFSDGALDKEQ
ncbi:hypothetical protein LSAT2_004704 [Lamellibrachia satsuma]|nr:hypothetical protein LSAT2_004704 [Lamellibrachia satsuma]